MSTERPSSLFHGSPNKGIEVLEPRRQKVRSETEGPVVFATPEKVGAMKSLMWSDDSWTQLSTHNGTHIVLIAMDRDAFIAQDKGGACYEVPGDTFYCDPSFPTGQSEWVSKEPVTPIRKEIYPSALDAMIEHGVQVYFVTKADIDRYRENGFSLDAIQSMVSENELRGLPKPDFQED